MSTGNADEFPAHVRPDARRITVGVSEIYPPDYPAHLPVNLRATAGKYPVHWPEQAGTHPCQVPCA
jgi:hypothetical protein